VLARGSLRGATDFVPPQERLYGGGPSSVRGFNQNELGPVVYIVSARVDTVNAVVDTSFSVQRASPTGGNALLVGNLELRMRSFFWPELIQWVPFLDGGVVYNRGQNTVRLDELRWTPGLGVRVASPVGPIRLDVAYNGYPRRAGPAYVVGDDALTCVSPGFRGSLDPGQSCPSTFVPPPNKTFFSRLVFHFSIGQAF
jgi:outer membrane protein insertion porin family/translocation and assembly module TamA